MTDYEDLTDEDVKAIKALKRLAKKWPDSLMLFAGGGGLTVRRPPGRHMDIVDSIAGIPADGGDGGDDW